MSGIDKIKERILKEARDKADKNIENGKNEVLQILNSAEKEALDKKSIIIKKAEINADEIKKSMISIAESESRKAIFMHKQKILDDTFDKAMHKLCLVPLNEYLSMLEQIILSSVETGSEELILNQKDKDRIGESFIQNINKKLEQKGLKGNIKISQTTVDILGGFVLKNGNIEFNNSFETLFRINKEYLEVEVYECLFSS